MCCLFCFAFLAFRSLCYGFYAPILALIFDCILFGLLFLLFPAELEAEERRRRRRRVFYYYFYGEAQKRRREEMSFE